MALRDEPSRQLVANYARCFETRILYSDIDAFRHLNNGATGRYFEEGRAELNIHVFGVGHIIDPPAGETLLFASVTIEYLRQAYYPGRAAIATGVARIGRSSWVLAQAAFQDGACFALAEVVMVKALDGRSASLTDAQRQGLAAQAFGNMA